MFQLVLKSVPDRCEHFHFYMHQNCSLILVCSRSPLLLNPLSSCLSFLGLFHCFLSLFSLIHLNGTWVFGKFAQTVLVLFFSPQAQRPHTLYRAPTLYFQNFLILDSFLRRPACGLDIRSPLA